MKNSRDEGFNALFITNVDFFGKFDYHVMYESLVHNKEVH
jgi:hypothetical protein